MEGINTTLEKDLANSKTDATNAHAEVRSSSFLELTQG